MNQLDLVRHAEGVMMSVRAHPGARNNAINGIHAGALKVSVRQTAEKGKANKAIITFLAKTFGVAKSKLAILSGESASQKRILIRDADLHEISKTIDELLK